MNSKAIPTAILENFRQGSVIPAMPLALDTNRHFDQRHQRAVIRYYIDAGIGGIAVGVHSTQFEIRNPEVGLFDTVLEFASREVDQWCLHRRKGILKIAGICGKTDQALREAQKALDCGYHAGLVSLAALNEETEGELIDHCRAIAEIMPVIGFYLQPAVGGRILPHSFWRGFAEIDNILGIKVAAFNRYQTLDVVRAVAEAGRAHDITLYTGNDDNIVNDLLTTWNIDTDTGKQKLRMQGGLLGHWGVWTKAAVELLETIKKMRTMGTLPADILTTGAAITDMNAALFDTAHNFAGCIPGIHEVLRRNGLFQGTWCLNPHLGLSPGQAGELDRVIRAYPHLCDDRFVQQGLSEWLT